MSKRTQQKQSAFAAGKLANNQDSKNYTISDNPYKGPLAPIWVAGYNGGVSPAEMRRDLPRAPKEAPSMISPPIRTQRMKNEDKRFRQGR